MTRWNTLLAFTLLSSSVMAEQTVTLQDGKQVRLKDDFTWEYISTSTEQIPTNTEQATTFEAIPVVQQAMKGTTITVGNDKPSLQLSKSGLDVLIGASTYEDGQLILPVSVTNQSTQSVVLVTLTFAVYSPTGELLHEGSFDTWQSIKRLADTYLRPQTSAKGKDLIVDVGQYPEYRIEVDIESVVTR
ncbi:DUF3157 family protein [Vibrio gallaecicus]|uniref:DUF3157 family protein n=1 Tax=Vibrio gallaecicus TaxID=552386 RepID=A0ABV4N850_9VIBR